jgi:signal transduction histidine kinase
VRTGTNLKWKKSPVEPYAPIPGAVPFAASVSLFTALVEELQAPDAALRGPGDELKALGDTLDELFARLQAAFDAQRHFAANASHELRTPLTRERAMLQVALDDPATTAETWRGVAAEVLASNTEQESLIEALLALASGEGGLGHREPVDLAAITGQTLTARRPGLDRHGLRAQAGLRPAALDGDPLLTERLVANLIDNAVRHNTTGGHVQISTATRDGHAVLAVANTGPAIPPEAVGRLFQPFWRLGGRRIHHDNGHGLGLAIVRAIAAAHGAAITARARPGGGLAIDVTFPPPASAGDNPPKPQNPATASASGNRACGQHPRPRHHAWHPNLIARRTAPPPTPQPPGHTRPSPAHLPAGRHARIRRSPGTAGSHAPAQHEPTGPDSPLRRSPKRQHRQSGTRAR